MSRLHFRELLYTECLVKVPRGQCWFVLPRFRVLHGTLITFGAHVNTLCSRASAQGGGVLTCARKSYCLYTQVMLVSFVCGRRT